MFVCMSAEGSLVSLTKGFCVTKASVSCSPTQISRFSLTGPSCLGFILTNVGRKVCLEFKYIKVIRSPPTEPQHRWLQMRLAQRGAAPDSAHSFKHTQIHICKNKHNRMRKSGHRRICSSNPTYVHARYTR